MDIENTASSVISSDKIKGTNVGNPAGEKLGLIDTLMIDKLSGKVRYAVMEFGGFWAWAPTAIRCPETR